MQIQPLCRFSGKLGAQITTNIVSRVPRYSFSIICHKTHESQSFCRSPTGRFEERGWSSFFRRSGPLCGSGALRLRFGGLGLSLALRMCGGAFGSLHNSEGRDPFLKRSSTYDLFLGSGLNWERLIFESLNHEQDTGREHVSEHALIKEESE